MQTVVWYGDAVNECHLGEHPSINVALSPVRVASLIPRKRHFRQTQNSTFWLDQDVILCIIARGSGTLQEPNGSVVELTAPCAIVLSPLLPCRYGPRSGWEEYVIHFQPVVPKDFMAHWGISCSTVPIFTNLDIQAIRARMDAILSIGESPNLPGASERIDHLAHLVLLDILKPLQTATTDSARTRILEAERELRHNFTLHTDIERLAQRYGFSRSTFLRQWMKTFIKPPHQIITELRLDAAYSRLVQTEESVKTISAMFGFSNSLYFSRSFRKKYGASPIAMRNKVRSHESSGRRAHRI